MLSLYSWLNELLRGLLELLFGRLRVSVRHTCLVLYLDVDGLPRVLLALSRLVTYAAIHRVVHHASVEGVRLWLLSRASCDNRASYYAKSAGVLRLALLLQLWASLHGACHCYVASGVLFQLLGLWNVCVLGKTAAELTLVAVCWLAIVFLFVVLLLKLLLLLNVTLSQFYVFVLLLACVGILVHELTVGWTQGWGLVHQAHLVLDVDRVHRYRRGS